MFPSIAYLPCAYCYLCYISSEKAQSSKRLDNPGFKIKRSIEGIWSDVDILEEKWRSFDTKKTFKDFFTGKERKFMMGYPTLKPGGFSILNVPTMHFKTHVFDVIKKLNYQMNSRKYTDSEKCVAEIQALRSGKDKMKKYKMQPQQCRNPKCCQICKGFVALKPNVMKKKQPKKCLLFYTQEDILEGLERNTKEEKKFRKELLNQTLLQKCLDDAKYEFTNNVKEQLGICVNEAKVASHGGSVENGPATIIFLHPDNRNKAKRL